MPALLSRGGVISLFPLSALIFSSRCAFFSPVFFSRADFLCVHLLGGFLLRRSRAASGDAAPASQKFNPPRCLLLKINYTCRAREITPDPESPKVYFLRRKKIVLLSSCISGTAAVTRQKVHHHIQMRCHLGCGGTVGTI